MLAAITLPLGFTSGGNTPSWNGRLILITVVWVAYAIVFFGTIAVRKVKPHIYVANWFLHLPSS